MSWPGGDVSGGVDCGFSEDPNDILVFGYGAKLFRDDEKALWVEKEEHLIPWMGDPELKVDRYDGRGALMDLRPFVAKGGGYSEQMDEEERELEKVLDHERYLDLKEDEDFNEMEYQEVEFKKFQSDVNGVVEGSHQSQHYAAISYNYEEKSEAASEILPQDKGTGGKDELPYSAPAGLIVPVEVTVPTTMKLHAIMEKTAKFIASHGNQMEIILKTKQSGNPLFNFLEYRDVLNPYYKFLVQAIRSSSYKPSDDPIEVQFDSPAATPHEEECTDSEEEDSGYLHPSLFKTNSISDSKTNSIKYKPSTGPTAYSLLVSKIQEVSGNSEPPPVAPSTTGPPQHLSQEDSFYYYNIQNSPTSSFGYQLAGYPSVNPGIPVTTEQYDQGATSAQSRPKNQVPSEQEQQVIEKMASYVVKNGPAFEELAKTRGDPRFVFLNPSHEFHWYYLNCKERYKAETSSVVAQGNFVKYGDSTSTSSSNSSVNQSRFSENQSSATQRKSASSTVSKITSLPSISLPLSASGIPIANHASFSNRPTSIPPEVASRIEEIRRKKDLLKKEQATSSALQDSLKDCSKSKIQFSSLIGKSMPLGASDQSLFSSQEVQKEESSATESTNASSNNKLPSPSTVECGNGNATIKSVETIAAKTENANSSKSSAVDPMQEDKEKTRLRIERKRKAALFLMNLQNKSSVPKPNDNLVDNGLPKDREVSIQKENGNNSDVDSIPDTEKLSNKTNILKGNGSYSSDGNHEFCKERSASSVEYLATGGDSEKSSHHRSKSRSRSISRRSSYIRRSRSSSSSSVRSKKRSKSKHSKKRKKKREKDKRSRSSSKKSKRRKYDR